MPKAIWQDTLLAESDETILIEGNHYFPPEAVNWKYLHENDARRTSPWKGVAKYYDVVVGRGKLNEAAAWSYPDPHPPAVSIKDYVAFWKGVEITLDEAEVEQSK